MPTPIVKVQIANPDERERIFSTIRPESLDFPKQYEISIAATQRGSVYEILIKSPDGNKVSRNLQESLGDLSPAIFEIRLRELFKLL